MATWFMATGLAGHFRASKPAVPSALAASPSPLSCTSAALEDPAVRAMASACGALRCKGGGKERWKGPSDPDSATPKGRPDSGYASEGYGAGYSEGEGCRYRRGSDAGCDGDAKERGIACEKGEVRERRSEYGAMSTVRKKKGSDGLLLDIEDNSFVSWIVSGSLPKTYIE